MNPMTPPPGFYFLVTLFWLVVACTILMVLVKIAAWWGDRVSRSADNDANDMSSSEYDMSSSAPSSLRTDGPPDGRTAQPVKPSAEQLFTLYRLMREYGIKRDEAAAALRAANLPLSNDVWRRAEPPPQVPAPSDDDDVLVTPFAGRRTRASYYPDDPELEFQSPA